MMWTLVSAHSPVMDAGGHVEELFYVARFAPMGAIAQCKKQWRHISIYLVKITHDAPYVQKSSIFGL